MEIFSVVRSDGFNYMRLDGTPAVAVDQLDINMSYGQIFGALANRNEGIEEDYIVPEDEGDLAWWLYPYSAHERIRAENPSGVTGVWGTFWSNLINPSGGGETTVLSGHAKVTSGGEQPPVALSGGQGTVVPPATPPIPPAPLTPEQQQQFSGVSEWILQTAGEIQNNVPPPLTPPTPPVMTPFGQTPGTTPPVVTPATPPVAPPPNVINSIQQALESVGAVTTPATSSGSRDSDSDNNNPPPPEETAPSIGGGLNEISLSEGYPENQTSYEIGGNPAPDCSVEADASIAGYFSFTDGILTVASGLEPDSYEITLKAANGISPDASKSVTVSVEDVTVELPPERILPDAFFGEVYEGAALTASGGVEPYTYSLIFGDVGGPLPTGLELSETGEISGTYVEGELY